MGFAVASSAIVVPAAFAQNTTNPGGNNTVPGWNQTNPGGNQAVPGGNVTQPLATPRNGTMQDGNQTMPNGNSTQPVAFTANPNNKDGITMVQFSNNNSIMPEQGAQMQGQIRGTIDVKQAIKNFLADNVNVTLSEAVATAEAQINGTAVAGHLDVVQGFLVYSVIVVDMNNEIIHWVVVDAGDGSVLASHSIPLAQLEAMHGGMMGMHGGMFGSSQGGQMMMMPPGGNQTSQGSMTGMPSSA